MTHSTEITAEDFAALLGATPATLYKRSSIGVYPLPITGRRAWLLKDVTSILTAEAARLRARAKAIDAALRGS